MNNDTFQMDLAKLSLTDLFKFSDDLKNGTYELDEANEKKFREYLAKRIISADFLEDCLEKKTL